MTCEEKEELLSIIEDNADRMGELYNSFSSSIASLYDEAEQAAEQLVEAGYEDEAADEFKHILDFEDYL